MAAIDQNDFQRGDDFISFGASPPPAGGPSEAGPSRSALSSADQDIFDTRNGQSRQDAPAAQGKKKDKSKKGKGKEKATESHGDVSGKKRPRGGDDPFGPRNLKEERRAAERHAPWTDLVDWDACQDPAEMYAFEPLSLSSRRSLGAGTLIYEGSMLRSMRSIGMSRRRNRSTRSGCS
jgi:non-canonical poly(A) RNA polymerase PAPD5/7